ncbi:hypothetical protein BJ165DRAFT_1522937 [Panaeolus papilionaceus]|nr:hypothetical protein BJ165DRAFT_1522937 [Panaeolus papilionaceus]
MWDEPVFQSLLKNNDKPPDSLIPGLHERLIGPSAELDSIDRETDDLNQQFQKLQNECNEIESSISRYKQVIAPLRILPDDILREIFLQCALSACPNPPKNPLSLVELPFPSPEAIHLPPILLTRICKRWRDVALTTPQLWSRIAFTLPFAHPPIPDDDNAPIKHIQRLSLENSLKYLKGDCLPRAINTFLKQSGATPLSISIPGADGTFAADSHPDIFRSVEQIFRDLASHADRWKWLQIHMTGPAWFLLSKHLTPRQLGNLEHLDFNHISSWFHDITLTDILKSPIFNDLPSLRSLVWRSLEGTESPRPFGTCTWNNFTDVHILNYADIPNTVFILECPSLVNCSIIVSDSRRAPLPPSRRLTMPRIEILSLALTACGNYEGSDLDTDEEPTYHISAPQLRKLKYDTQGEPISLRQLGATHNHAFSAFPLGSIIEGAPNLTELEVVVAAEAMEEVKRALHQPRVVVERLVLGSKNAPVAINRFGVAITTSDMTLEHLFPLPNWCSLTLDSTDRDLLKIANMGCEVLDEALDNCTFPRLIHLEVLGLDSITDDFILSLVVYRLRLYKHIISRQQKADEEQRVNRPGAATRNRVDPWILNFGFSSRANRDPIDHMVERFAELVDMQAMYHLMITCKRHR